ncbi:putative branchpoint-bridging protein [Diaporthe ampelina]|uniref:Branchpoint-bridging protein n=1 Tax=Diaporthe ampelina TaxID=1214573 RepID=A0A0G2IGH5_9PEZI|nr:putative branchpoint-bridging protein [Diaporthe ampelina]
MTPEQLDAYAVRFRIEEIGQTIRAGESAQRTDPERSPSPPPKYDSSGRRINTRQHRYRQRLEEERQTLMGTALNTIPRYQAPRDFRGVPPPLITEKVYIPVKDFPDVKFIGQILGPRGQSLTDMNNQSGANIAIRGKGSVKEGRAAQPRGHRYISAATSTDDQQEPLHCLIRADTREKVDHAKKLVNEVIEAAASAPEDQNRRKRDQLRQLAVMNGTFRDDERQACGNCGQTGHRHYFCTVPPRSITGVTCHSCKSAGHVARDCAQKGTGPVKVPPWRKDRFLARQQEATGQDDEFEQLMLEIGN